jgi:ABC-2 type transport system permease protein
VRFVTGLSGVVVFVLLAAAWGVAFSGFPYAIALRTGNPGAVAASIVLTFPFIFLTPAFVPLREMNGGMRTIAAYNPVTYLLDALRSLSSEGWVVTDLAKAVLAVAVLAALSQTIAFLALRRRVDQG